MATAGRGRRSVGRPGRPAALQPPPQGVSAFIAFLLLMALVGVAVSDARRTLGPGSGETGFIAWLMPLGGLVGYVVARTSLSLLTAHALGAAVGTLAILAALSAALTGTDVLAWQGVDEVGRRMTVLWEDLVRLALSEPGDDGRRPWGFAMLVLGGLCWATAQFGAMSVFRHGRATPAVGSAGILLFLDILVPSAYRGIDPVPIAIAFAALALALLVRLHLSQQQSGWARRSVTEGPDVARVFLGAGALFVTAVVIGASALTTFAVAERGTIPWQSLAQPFESVRQELLRMLEGLGVSIPPERPPESLFSDRQAIPDRWQLGEGTAFRAFIQGDLRNDPYWFGAAYDTFTRDGYRYSGEVPADIDEGELRVGDLEIPSRGARFRESFTTTIAPDRDGHYTLLGPATTTEVTASVRGRVLVRVPGGARVTVDLEPGWSVDPAYDVVSSEVSFGLADGTVSADDLRASGRRPDRDGLQAYLDVGEGLVGPATDAFIRQIARRTQGRRDNTYDVALEVQDTMRGWRYDTDMTGVCGDRTAAECLIEEKRGFCSYYATAMAIVLRELGIPTRLVHGYLPGIADGPNSWTVPLQAAHAWVEVWFDGVGWIRFDPTPELEGFGSIDTRLPEEDPGGELPDPSLEPVGPSPSPEGAAPSPSPSPVADGGAAAADGGAGPDLAVLALLVAGGLLGVLAAGAGVALFLVRRLPGGDATRAYRGIVALASRLGHGPAPSQTELEYVSALGEALPSVSQDLQLVGKAHVRAVYGRRRASDDMLAPLRQAYARARTALLRFLVRR